MERASGPTEGTDRLVRELVGSPQRRRILRYLDDNGGDATFEEIVDVLDGPEPTMTAVRLHHVHLPKLAAAGGIEWRPETERVRLTARLNGTLDVVEADVIDQAASD